MIAANRLVSSTVIFIKLIIGDSPILLILFIKIISYAECRFQIWYCCKEWYNREKEREMNTLIKRIVQRTERIVTPTSRITMLICFNTILCRCLLIYMSQTCVLQVYDSGEKHCENRRLFWQNRDFIDEINLQHPRNFAIAHIFSRYNKEL